MQEPNTIMACIDIGPAGAAYPCAWHCPLSAWNSASLAPGLSQTYSWRVAQPARRTNTNKALMPPSRSVSEIEAQAERREKRTAKLQGYVPPSLRAFYEELVANHPTKSLSDVVYEALEEQAAMRIAKQNLGGRVGRN